ncbi:unnamed protein product, partial [Brassica oleracea var. botrytis]
MERAIKEPDPRRSAEMKRMAICRAFVTLIMSNDDKRLFPLSLLKNRKIVRRVNASINTQSC